MSDATRLEIIRVRLVTDAAARACPEPPTDCDELHRLARSSEGMMRHLARPIGIQRKSHGVGPLLLGNCPRCGTTLATIVEEEEA